MDNTKYIALSRQMALWKQMNVVSNNVANMNTTGFKQEGTIFSTFVAQTLNAKDMGNDPVYFTQDLATYTDFLEGALVETGNTFDVALQGDGFFAVETDQGISYTRKGNFTLDRNGMMVTTDGYPVLSQNNEPIFIAPTETEVVITEDGSVSTENGIIGRLNVVKFADNNKLVKRADTMFDNVAGNQQTQADDVRVVQRSLEKSNVNAVEEMTKLIQLQRSYDFVQQMIDEEHDRISNTIETYSQLA
ncbi:MAG: flagellar basal-body rod protein FlgF [Alphaproteobacteria bacterium]|nr:flagellar basal-body rod protein FlgF [Alphaproteobacteria bacterium]